MTWRALKRPIRPLAWKQLGSKGGMKDQAQTLGYTVVDASTVIATHLNQLVSRHTHELLGHEEVQKLLDSLAQKSPKLVEELVPNQVSINTLLKVLQNLLKEKVPIRDMRTIAEAIAASSSKSQDADSLTSAVRVALARTILQAIVGREENLPVISLNPSLEQILLKSVQQAQKAGAPVGAFVEPGLAQQLQAGLSEAAQRQEIGGKPVVILVASAIRSLVSQIARVAYADAWVLSYNEVPETKRITIEATVGNQQSGPAE